MKSLMLKMLGCIERGLDAITIQQLPLAIRNSICRVKGVVIELTRMVERAAIAEARAAILEASGK